MKIKIDMITLASLFLLVWILELVFPPLTAVTPASAVSLLCGLAWLALSFFSGNHFFLRVKRNYFILPIVFYLLTFGSAYFWGNSIVAHRYMSMMMLPFGSVIYGFYNEKKRLTDLKRVLVIGGVFATVTFIRTLLGLLINPYIVRSIKSSEEVSTNLAAQGIGAYGFIYMMVAVSVLLLFVYLNMKNGIKRFFVFAIYVISLFFIIKSNYMTAFLVSIVSSVVLIITFLTSNQRSPNNSLKLILQIVAISIGMILIFNIDRLIGVLTPILPRRIASVLVTNVKITDAIWQEFIGGRFPVMKQSWDTFLLHPIFGGVGAGIVGMSGGFLTNVGQHSYILDTFAFFGFLIGFINIYVIYQPFKIQKNNHGNGALRISMIVCMIGIYLFNNATESIALIFGIVYPFIDDLIARRNKVGV